MKLVAVLAALCLFNAGLCLNDKEYPTNSGVQLLTSPPTQPEQQLMTTSIYQPQPTARVYQQPPQPTSQQG